MSAIPRETQVLRRDVTVVVITHNRLDSLARTLSWLDGLTGVFEVIVVDNATDQCDLADVCRQYDSVRLIRVDRNHGAAARNIGVDAASTPFVAFCDDDSWWEADAIVRARAYFGRYPDVALIAGRVLVGSEQRLDPVSALQSISPLPRLVPMPGPAILGFLACSVIVRTDAFRGVGGFSPLFGVGGEEALLAIDLAAAGWGLTYAEDVVAYHYPSSKRLDCLRQRTETRNSLWVAWMRRRSRSVLPISLRQIRRAPGNRCSGRGLLDALRGTPRVLRQRRAVPPWLEEQLRLLESGHD